MARLWDADVEITDSLVERLIRSQFPEMPLRSLERIGLGWDNAAYLADGDTVFRLPRRAVAAHLVTREARILPLLAEHLPLPIPIPTHLGKSTDEYPYDFVGFRFMPGQTACSLSLSDREPGALAPELGRFLSALHRIPVSDDVRAWAPPDEIARTDLGYRLNVAKERADSMRDQMPEFDFDALIGAMSDLADIPPWNRPTVWVHGDLYSCHLLVEDGRISGVIDWGDVHLGDPALDLSIAFSFFPKEGRGAFRDAYGAIDEDTWGRARFRAMHYGLVLTQYGQECGNQFIERAGLDALTHTL